MKNSNRILAMLMAVLLLCSAMSAFAEVEVELDAPQDIEVFDLDADGLDLDISPEAFELSDDLTLVEEEPEAAAVVSNADDETSSVIYDSFTLEVGQQKKIHNHVRTYYSLIITDTSSDPNVARIGNSGIVTAVTAGKCLITVTAVDRWRKDEPPKVFRYDVTVVGGSMKPSS